MMAVFCLSFDLFRKAVFRVQTDRYEKWYIVTIFLVPLGYNWIPFIGNAYGLNGGILCWIRQRNFTGDCSVFEYGLALQFVLYWVPWAVGMTGILVASVWALIVTRMRRYAYEGTFDPTQFHYRSKLEKEVRHYQIYPIVYFLIKILQPLRLIVEGAGGPSFVFYVIHDVTEGLEGALIGIGFLLSYICRRELWWRGNLQTAFSSSKGRGRLETYGAILDSNVTDSLAVSQNAKT